MAKLVTYQCASCKDYTFAQIGGHGRCLSCGGAEKTVRSNNCVVIKGWETKLRDQASRKWTVRTEQDCFVVCMQVPGVMDFRIAEFPRSEGPKAVACCSAPDVIENVACFEWFLVCRNCKKEVNR